MISDRSRPRLILIVLLVWAAISQTCISGYILYETTQAKNIALLPFFLVAGDFNIRGVRPNGVAAGLRSGDLLTMLDGKPVTGFRQIAMTRMHMKPGDMLHMVVRRPSPQGGMETIPVTVPMEANPRAALGWVFAIGLFTFLPGICLALGFFVAFSRPRDSLAWITLAMLVSVSQTGATPSAAIPSPWREIAITYHTLLNNLWPFWTMLFGLYFPAPFHFLRGRRYIPVLLALPFLVMSIIDDYVQLMLPMHALDVQSLVHTISKFNSVGVTLSILYIASFFVSLAVKARKTTHPDARRRLQWILSGCGLALLPALILVVCQELLKINLPIWFVVTAVLLIVLFPLTLAYVIVVQRAMEVRVAMRIGVQYAFARGGITVLRIVIPALAIWGGIVLGSKSHLPLLTALFIGISVGVVFGIRWIGQRVIVWTDRRFFREAYDTEVILTELSRTVAGIRDTKALLETVSKSIADSLHVPRVAVLLRETSDSFRPAYSLGYNTSPSVELTPEATTVQVLGQSQQPSSVYFEDEKSWVQRTPDQEREMLRLLDSQLLLPVALKERLLGIISLSPKLSEEPYSPADMRLLHAVASQTGLALENARLTEHIRTEVAQRERINRELEIAREVQERLFPQALPEIDGLDFAGYCRPQQGVGGDYYDFVHLDNGNLGIAVGDVSGKGIGAALMMASLQATFRGQTIRPTENLAETIQFINRLVYQASASNRYATFFYAQYNPWTRKLRYVNAGHNPPLVYRTENGEPRIVRLEEGGTVIGLFPEYPYQESEVEMLPGDVLVAYTDGISEAMNGAEEEWSEERLEQAIAASQGRSAADIIAVLLSQVDTFTAGTQQYDDMTLVVVRVK